MNWQSVHKEGCRKWMVVEVVANGVAIENWPRSNRSGCHKRPSLWLHICKIVYFWVRDYRYDYISYYYHVLEVIYPNFSLYCAGR